MTQDKALSPFQILALGLLLLAMFLGAGNVIFAPMVGQQAGEHMWVPMAGFLITGVGLVLLAIIALSQGGGTVDRIANRVGPRFSFAFCLLLFLALGPLYVIPRTTSVVYEITVSPNLTEDLRAGPWALLVFSVIFTALTIYLSLNPGRFVDRIGKLITPLFSILLIIIVVTSLVNPMGTPQPPVEPFTSDAFFTGFTEGYLTMDVLAALVFAGIFIHSIKGQGITSRSGLAKTFLKAGIVTVIGLTLLHISLAWIGASSVDAIGRPNNGGALLAEASRYLLGFPGLAMIGVVIFLTGWTTNVACVTAVADYFARKFPSVSYTRWVYINSIAGLIFANFGLTAVLNTALPLLFLLYPIGITLIVLVLVNRIFEGRHAVYIGAMIGVVPFAILDSIKSTGFMEEQLNSWFSFIPLFSANGGWIIPTILGAGIGYAASRAKNQPPVVYDTDLSAESDIASENTKEVAQERQT